eukprot:6390429-Amphidinium_carterae.4
MRLVSRKGSCLHALRVRVKNSSPIFQYCERHELPKSARFETSVYTEAGAMIVARCWQKRITYLWTYWGEGAAHESAEDIDKEWIVAPELTALLPQLPARGRDRVQRILAMCV